MWVQGHITLQPANWAALNIFHPHVHLMLRISLQSFKTAEVEFYNPNLIFEEKNNKAIFSELHTFSTHLVGNCNTLSESTIWKYQLSAKIIFPTKWLDLSWKISFHFRVYWCSVQLFYMLQKLHHAFQVCGTSAFKILQCAALYHFSSIYCNALFCLNLFRFLSVWSTVLTHYFCASTFIIWYFFHSVFGILSGVSNALLTMDFQYTIITAWY